MNEQTPKDESKAAVGQSALNVELGSVVWEETTHCEGEDTLYACNLEDGGRITVLDRMTGYGNGIRDVESGYRNKDGKFWLASGGFDVRSNADFTATQAIEWIKKNANTCIDA